MTYQTRLRVPIEITESTSLFSGHSKNALAHAFARLPGMEPGVLPVITRRWRTEGEGRDIAFQDASVRYIRNGRRRPLPNQPLVEDQRYMSHALVCLMADSQAKQAEMSVIRKMAKGRTHFQTISCPGGTLVLESTSFTVLATMQSEAEFAEKLSHRIRAIVQRDLTAHGYIELLHRFSDIVSASFDCRGELTGADGETIPAPTRFSLSRKARISEAPA